ncbi:glycerol-3-phosphate dehydrogenase/oxidase [Ammoniphilus sp. CFH 90114]|nr:glycerol-3-phosphate dehydrogenase/oxidase [Ammoniphilus sp. CFH 90114]
MASDTLDVLVIGGGITGAGIALDGSVRGLHIGLVEKADFGSGTSSRSTKLIHGGLRYLKQGEVKLVQEVGKEREILYRNAPHLVIPAPMLLPIYKGGTYGYWASSIGLYIYDVLAGVARKERRKMLRSEATKKTEPLLKVDGLKGGGLYYEYRTDDARLTLDIVKTAVKHGAKAINYAKVTEFIYDSTGQVVGVKVQDQLNGKRINLFAKKVVNAAGPWVDGVRDLDGSLQGKRLFLTKGVHLVVDYQRLPVKQSAYFDTPDGRMVFVIPRGRITYIGTTDTAYDQSIDEPRATKADRNYLIQAVNAMFPEVKLKEEDIESHWAGLRPLIYEEGKGPSELSRKDELFISSSGLITIAGGKLTGYRKMAEKVVNLVSRDLNTSLGRALVKCTTDQVIISGGERMGYTSFANWKKELFKRGVTLDLEEDIVREWIDVYGTNTLKIYKKLSDLPKNSPHRALRAQLAYSIEEEMTVNATDFLRLRTGWTYFNLKKATKYGSIIISYMAEMLGWDQTEVQKQKEMVSNLLKQIHELPDSDQPLRSLAIGE